MRPATAGDVKALATVMARAFYDDPPFIWMAPDPATRLQRLRRFFATLTRGEALAQAMARAHPREPHWYLYAIGVDPARQKTGLAGALLRPRLGHCDADGQPAYLEATKTTSVPLYQHFGFRPTGNPEMPSGAPPLTAMWRPPATAPPAP